MASPHERDEVRVVMSYIKSGWSVGKAVTQAKSASNKKHIRISCSADLMAGLEDIMEDFRRQSDEFKEKGGGRFSGAWGAPTGELCREYPVQVLLIIGSSRCTPMVPCLFLPIVSSWCCRPFANFTSPCCSRAKNVQLTLVCVCSCTFHPFTASEKAPRPRQGKHSATS